MREVYTVFGRVETGFEPHPLEPGGYIFADEDVPVVTDWKDVLPPRDFSWRQFKEVERLAQIEELTFFDDERALLLARHLWNRQGGLSFDDEFGCWVLPLASEHDENGRSRYPQLKIKALGIHNRRAHTVAWEVFLNRNIDEERVLDHRCRRHACCNPYHLQSVTSAENTWRGAAARRCLNGHGQLLGLFVEVGSYGDLNGSSLVAAQ